MDKIDWRHNQDLMTAPLLGLEAVLLYVVTRGRNAWHSTWVRNYKGPRALLGDFERARRHAEFQRVQGSVFYISQVPGIALHSEHGSVTLVEFHSDNPYGKWDRTVGGRLLQIGTPMATTLRALGRSGPWLKPIPSQHSFISGFSGDLTLTRLPKSKPLERWTSYSNGTNYRLGWKSDRARYTRRGVRAVERAFTEVNEALIIDEAQDRWQTARAARIAAAGEAADQLENYVLAWLNEQNAND